MRTSLITPIVLGSAWLAATPAHADKILGATVGGSLVMRDGQWCSPPATDGGVGVIYTFSEAIPVDNVILQAAFEGRVEVMDADGHTVSAATLTSSGAFTDARLGSGRTKTVTVRIAEVRSGTPCFSDVAFLARGKQHTVIAGVEAGGVDSIGTALAVLRRALTTCDRMALARTVRFPLKWNHFKKDTGPQEDDIQQPGMALVTVEYPEAAGLEKACRAAELPPLGEVGVTGGAPGQAILERSEGPTGSRAKFTLEWKGGKWMLVEMMSRDRAINQ